MDYSDIIPYIRQGNWECTYSLEHFIKQIEDFENKDGLQMNPDFQRGHVWTEEQQIKFVEHILKGGITGRTIYLNHPSWNQDNFDSNYNDFVCVDGLQRTTAIQKFIRNEIPAFGTLYKDFTGNMRLTQRMNINVNDLPSKKEVLDWYIQMNDGGTPHTKEEIDKVRELLKTELKKG